MNLKEWCDEFSKIWRVSGRSHLLHGPRDDVLEEGLHEEWHGRSLVAVQDEEHASKLERAAQRLDLVALDEEHDNVLQRL